MAFEKLIGQTHIKNKLSFYLDVYNKTNQVPFLSFVGARGLGKTAYAREFANYILNSNGERKKFIEINCSTIKSAKQFFEQVFLSYVYDSEVTVLFDECHALPKSLVYAFLTVLNTENSPKRDYVTADNVYSFDFSKHHFFFATTESQQIFPPMRDRLTQIEFSDYSKDDLKLIFKSKLEEYEIDSEALDLLAESSRGNARSCILRSKDIRNYCEAFSLKRITKRDIEKSFSILGILPFGLNRIEYQILDTLKNNGPSTLSMLAAKTGLSKSSLQNEHESFLLKNGFMFIDGQRKITNNGIKVLERLSEKF